MIMPFGGRSLKNVIFTNASTFAIRENKDPRSISAIRYMYSLCLDFLLPSLLLVAAVLALLLEKMLFYTAVLSCKPSLLIVSFLQCFDSSDNQVGLNMKEHVFPCSST